MKIQPLIYSTNTQKKYETFKNNINNSSFDYKEISLQTELSNYCYVPVSFSSKNRTNKTDKTDLAELTGNFKISKFCNLPCPACGKKMLNREKYDQIAYELSKLPPEEYLNFLGQYKEYMRPVEESVYDEIYALSEKNGASKDIRTLLVNLRDTKLPVLQKAQMHHIKKMKALAKSLPNDEKAILINKTNSLQHLIHKNNAMAPFRRKIMIDKIGKIKISNPKKYEKLQNIAKSFPASSDTNSAWIVKYSGKNKNNKDWNSYDIALRFLSSSIANTDHIIAYKIENNHNDISNYMSMHNACNSQKADKSFLKWINEDKDNRIKYIEDYLNNADELVKTKIKDNKYNNYKENVINTIFKASKGRIKLFDNKQNNNN